MRNSPRSSSFERIAMKKRSPKYFSVVVIISILLHGKVDRKVIVVGPGREVEGSCLLGCHVSFLLLLDFAQRSERSWIALVRSINCLGGNPDL